MLSLVNKTTLTWSRLPYDICKGYTVNAITKVSGKVTSVKLDDVDNPKVPNLVAERQVLKFNTLRKWQLPADVVAGGSDDIKVYINNVQITTNSYTYNPNIRVLYLNDTGENNNTLIEIEYYTDKVLYVCKTNIICEYEVIPIYNESYRIGQHTVL